MAERLFRVNGYGRRCSSGGKSRGASKSSRLKDKRQSGLPTSAAAETQSES